jgi:type II secretory pathway component GspD/PulD (secretin)
MQFRRATKTRFHTSLILSLLMAAQGFVPGLHGAATVMAADEATGAEEKDSGAPPKAEPASDKKPEGAVPGEKGPPPEKKPELKAPPPPPARLAVPAAAEPQPEGEEKAAAGTPLVTVGMNEGRIEQAASIISSQINMPVNVYGKAAGAKVTVIAQDQPVEAALGMISNPNGFIWWKDAAKGEYGIADKDYYEKNILVGQMIQKVFRPNNIKASELDRAIKGLLTPNLGSSVADDRTNKLIVYDLPVSLERVERFIREIDVQLVVRVFYIRHADVEDIAKKIETYKSDPGTIEVDTKTHKIVVTDLLSNIKKMELLIDILDVAPEIVIYDVNNIGIDGEDLEDLRTIIEGIRTNEEGLLFEVNEKQGVIILEDVPEVHERVEQVLAGFDQPVKQVMIQGEILSTSFKRNFSMGLNSFATADKVLSASAQKAFTSLPLDAAGVGTGAIPPGTHFYEIENIYPNLNLAGKTLTGNYLSQTVALQYQAAYDDESTRVLLQPRLLVKNQQPSKIFVGQEVPYLTTFYDDGQNNNNSSGRTTTTQSTVTSGLTFDVTPSISNSYLIELDLKIDNDDAQRITVIDGGVERSLIQRDRQNVETILQIPSGQTRMIGGLVNNENSNTNKGFPFLTSLPYLGYLFGVKGDSKVATNLLIFITPTIVEDNIPRMTGKDGRRGRLVTDYEKVPSELDLQSGEEAQNQPTKDGAGIEAPTDPADLLSSNSEEESELLDSIKAMEKKKQTENEEETSGNYKPSLGFGSATLNVGGSPAGATGRPAGVPAGNQNRPNNPARPRPGQPTQPGPQQPTQNQPNQSDEEDKGNRPRPQPQPPAETTYR